MLFVSGRLLWVIFPSGHSYIISSLLLVTQNNQVDERYRYIRYVDGSEELYDHDNDPNEFTNLYKDPNYADVKARLKARLPKVDMPSWQSEDGSMKLNVDITCNFHDVTVKRCPGNGNPYFVARDPNNNCEFLECPDYDPEPTASPTKKPTKLVTDEPTPSPSKSPAKDPTASPTQDPTTSPTEAPVTVIDTSIAELLDFGITIDIPDEAARRRRRLDRSELAFYLNDNLEEILSESMLDELSRAIESSGFPFARPSGVNLTRKNKKVTDVDGGERYQVIYGGIITFAQTEKEQFLPTKADVQDMQVEALPRVADRVVDEVKEDMPEARISSVVTDVVATSDADEEEEIAPTQPQSNSSDSSNTLPIAIGCAVGGVVLVAFAAFFIMRSKKSVTKVAKDDASYNYPDEEDTDEIDDQNSPPRKKKGASTLAENALMEEDEVKEQAPSGLSAPEAASDVAGSTSFGH